MELTIPIFNQTVKQKGEPEPLFRLSALFFPNIHSEDVSLRRANSRLLDRARKELNPLGRSWNHAELASLAFNPELDGVRLKLDIELRSRRCKLTVFFVVFRTMDRYVAFAPSMPQLWIDLDRRTDLERRATTVLQEYFRKEEKDTESQQKPEHVATPGECWISWLDLNVRTDPITEAELQVDMLALFSNEAMDGATELNKVGRCLDQLYPDDLQRAILRENEIETLQRLMQHPSRRPVLILGPHKVGKTCLVHELVHRRVDARPKKGSSRANVWWLSPQRLISGMSFVGQWENRVLAILKEAEKRDHVLYFDDVISMFRAGQSRDSKLSVADLMKNAIQSRSVRVLAEMTHEAFHVLETRDRGFADMFQVVRMQPTSTQETQEIGIRVIQDLEQKFHCRFDWSALDTAIQLQERYATSASMPGKLISFLNELANANRGNSVLENDPRNLFRKSNGISDNILSNSAGTGFNNLRNSMRNQVIGQTNAIDVCADVMSVARAGLNEPGRPISTLLFLGPTGVGKTESAKVLCRMMFRDDKHLIRIDLNQFKSAWSASTLVGTPEKPEGLLTSAVRYQPFSVVLLDEIEKAHPSVFDILLQVLGEGRLTDALGRTTDFSNCVIVMTSNLGTRRNQQSLGFGARDDDQRYVKAAQDFFRPEFFNRIDHIVPFTSLKRGEVRQIARKLVTDITSREGLVRRFCVLQIDPSAIDHVVDLGFHPELGARAMKRALEEQFSRRVSRKLAAMPIDQPTIVRVSIPDSPENAAANDSERVLKVETKPIDEAQPTRPENLNLTPEQAIEQCQVYLDRINKSFLSERPTGEISSDGIAPELLRYFCLTEQRTKVEDCMAAVHELMNQKDDIGKPAITTNPRARSTFSVKRGFVGERVVMKEIFSARDINTYLNDIHSSVVSDAKTSAVEQMIDQVAVLDAMCLSDDTTRVVLFLRNLQGSYSSHYINFLRDDMRLVLQEEFGFEIVAPDEDAEILANTPVIKFVDATGPCINRLAEHLTGSYMHLTTQGHFTMFQVGIVPASMLKSKLPHEIVPELQEQLAAAQSDDSPLAIKPVNRLFLQNGMKVDFRSRISTPKMTQSIVREMAVRSLPLPHEFLTSLKEEN